MLYRANRLGNNPTRHNLFLAKTTLSANVLVGVSTGETEMRNVILAITLVMLSISAYSQTREEDEIMYQHKFDTTVRPVVKIVSATGNLGSGVVIYSNKFTLIISNEHVVGKLSPKSVEINGKKHKGTLLKSDAKADLALIRVATTTAYVAQVSTEPNLFVFEKVILVGCGQGLSPGPSLGIISRIDTEHGIMVDASIISGMSGGGVFRREGDDYYLIGIIRAMGAKASPIAVNGNTIMTSIPTIGYFIHLTEVFKFIGDAK